LKFQFHNSVALNASALDEEFNISHTTQCSFGVVKTVNYSCPSGSKNISHTCDGTKEYTITSTCPGRKTVPRCVMTLPTLSNRVVNCSVLSFTSDFTVCECHLCSYVALTLNSRRLGSSLDSNQYIAEAQGLTAYLAADYAAVTNDAAHFNAESLKHAEIVAITFGVLWGVMLGIIALIELSDSDSRMGTAKAKLQELLSYGKKQRTAAEKLAMIKKDETAAGFSLSQSTAEAKKYLREYVFTFFPNVFSEKPEEIKFWHEILHRHRYFSIFVRETGFNKFVGCLEILSLLTAHMFLIAVLFDAEWPNDTGYCKTLFTEPACVAKKSPFDVKLPVCVWDTTAGIAQCTWVEPHMDPSIQIILTMLVVAFSGPINVVVSMLIKMIIMAPPSDNLEELYNEASKEPGAEAKLSATTERERDAVIRVRRASAIGAMPKQRKSVVVPTMASILATEAGTSGHMSGRGGVLGARAVSVVADLDESLLPYCKDDHM
jgi:hypothetical protein